MQNILSTDRGSISRALPPAKAPASVVDDGRVKIGAGIGKPSTKRS